MIKVIKGKKVKFELSQRELAEEIGVHESYISRILDGTRTPSLPIARKLANVFGLTIEDTLAQLVNRKNGGPWQRKQKKRKGK